MCMEKLWCSQTSLGISICKCTCMYMFMLDEFYMHVHTRYDGAHSTVAIDFSQREIHRVLHKRRRKHAVKIRKRVGCLCIIYMYVHTLCLITGITIHCVAGATMTQPTTLPETSLETATLLGKTTPPEIISTLDNPSETYLPPSTNYNHTAFYAADYYDYPATPPPLPPPLSTPYKPILLSDIQSQLSLVLQNQDQIMATLKSKPFQEKFPITPH